jgi:hypothetical protein
METILKSWKTTAAGAALILVAALKMAGVDIPGFETAPGALLIGGIGLILGKDFNVSTK